MQVDTVGSRRDRGSIETMLEIDGVATVPNAQDVRKPTGEKDGAGIHVFVDRVGAVPIPHSLDRPTPGAPPNISPKPAAGDNLT